MTTQTPLERVLLSFHDWCKKSNIGFFNEQKKEYTVGKKRISYFLELPDGEAFVTESTDIESIIKEWVEFVRQYLAIAITDEETGSTVECETDKLVTAYIDSQKPVKNIVKPKVKKVATKEYTFELGDIMPEDSDYLVDWVYSIKTTMEDISEVYGVSDGSNDIRSVNEWVFKAKSEGVTICRMVVYDYDGYDKLQVGCDKKVGNAVVIRAFKKFIEEVK